MTFQQKVEAELKRVYEIGVEDGMAHSPYDNLDVTDQATNAIITLIDELIGEDETQQQRHWSDGRADWCGDVPNICICENLSALRADQRQKLHEEAK